MSDLTYTKVLAKQSQEPQLLDKLPAGCKTNLTLAIPTYGPTDPRHNRCVRMAVAHAASHGVNWIGDVSTDRVVHDGARNTAAKASVEVGADGIVWIDSDMIIPIDGITRLVSYTNEHDFVSGIYFQRHPNHFPLVYSYDKEIDAFRHMLNWPVGLIFPADAVGFGFCYTSTAMLKRMREELPEETAKGWFNWTKFSEDITFCYRAAKLGYHPYVDTSLLCGHLGDAVEVTVADFKRLNPFQAGTADPLVLPDLYKKELVND